MNSDFLILGAGVAGCTAARTLQSHGLSATLLDKGRGVGGRVATRRLGSGDELRGRWDHGAQFATFRDQDLIQQLKDWGVWPLLQPWVPGHLDPNLYRYRPMEGMNAFAKALAADLEIHRSERIEKLEKIEGTWVANSATGAQYQAPQLISTLPMPQFLELADASALPLSSEERKILQSIRYDRCLTLLAETDGPSGLKDRGYLRVNSGILETLVDQEKKGISVSHTLVAHASASFSLEWYDRNRNAAASILRAAVQEKIQSRITAVQIHGWKFAKATQRISRDYLALGNGILLAGDGFAAGSTTVSGELPPRIESAMLSGRAAAGNVNASSHSPK